MTTPLFAAVDLGSNAFRMMIGQRAPIGVSHVIKEVASFREPVRLSHGLRGSTLDESSLERGWQALERLGKRLQGFEPRRVRAVATNTVRVASNATVFLAKAEQRLGFQIDVISGHEEARLIYAGIAHTMPDANTTRLVLDIGGSSTELVIGLGEQLLAAGRPRWRMISAYREFTIRRSKFRPQSLCSWNLECTSMTSNCRRCKRELEQTSSPKHSRASTTLAVS